MKKVLGLLVALILGVAGVYWLNSSGSSTYQELRTDELKIRSIPKADETDYKIHFSVQFQKPNETPIEVTFIEGTLTTIVESDSEIASYWKDFHYRTNGKDREEIKPQTIGQTLRTNFRGERSEHSLTESFPKELLRPQLMILDRLFPMLIGINQASLLRQEEDDFVPFQAQYTFTKEKELTLVQKIWQSYLNPNSKVDPKLNHITYIFDANQRLLVAKGLVRSTFIDKGESELNIEFRAESIATRPRNSDWPSRLSQNFSLSNRDKIQAADKSLRAEQGPSFEASIKAISEVTDKTDGAKYYETFRALTDQIRAHPEYSQEIAKKILETKERDPSSRRQLSAMFGALAESQHNEGANTLVNLAQECPDNYCKVQALMGINTHTTPSHENISNLLEIARQSSDKEVAATSFIASGAAGRKMETPNPDLSKALIDTYKDPTRADMKTSLLAAMGNHGQKEYWPTLAESLKSEDSSIRSAAAYSLRYLPNDEVNATLLELVDKEPIQAVVSEAIKAVGFRKLTTDDYTRLGKRVGGIKSKDIAEQTASLLLNIHGTEANLTEKALQELRDGTPYKDVKLLIEQGLKKTPPNQN